MSNAGSGAGPAGRASHGEVEVVRHVVDLLVPVQVGVLVLVGVGVLVGVLVGEQVLVLVAVLVELLVGVLVGVHVHVGGGVAAVPTAGVGVAAATGDATGTTDTGAVAAAAVPEVDVDQTLLVDVATVATDPDAAAAVGAAAVTADGDAAVATVTADGLGVGAGVLVLVGVLARVLRGALVGDLRVDLRRPLLLRRDLALAAGLSQPLGEVREELVEVDWLAHCRCSPLLLCRLPVLTRVVRTAAARWVAADRADRTPDPVEHNARFCRPPRHPGRDRLVAGRTPGFGDKEPGAGGGTPQAFPAVAADRLPPANLMAGADVVRRIWRAAVSEGQRGPSGVESATARGRGRPMSYQVGVDLGATYSAAAVSVAGRAGLPEI